MLTEVRMRRILCPCELVRGAGEAHKRLRPFQSLCVRSVPGALLTVSRPDGILSLSRSEMSLHPQG